VQVFVSLEVHLKRWEFAVGGSGWSRHNTRLLRVIGLSIELGHLTELSNQKFTIVRKHTLLLTKKVFIRHW